MSLFSISTLFPNMTLPSHCASVYVEDITLDSRAVKSGSIFFAVQGASINREQFTQQAFESGAVAVVKALPDVKTKVSPYFDFFEEDPNRIVLYVPSLKWQVGHIAARFFDFPSSKMSVVGVTGTNGKTSCADLLSQLWRNYGYRAASLGTLGWSVEEGVYQPTGLTTLDAIENQRLIRRLSDQGITHLVMEVSSHGIDQGRVAGIAFDIKIITNISRDHLDYHGTMSEYAKTKLSYVFSDDGVAIFNKDDPELAKWIAPFMQSTKCELMSFGVQSVSATVHALNTVFSSHGLSVVVRSTLGDIPCKVNLMGDFNLLNLLAVISAFCALEPACEIQKLRRCVEKLKPVSGRMERVPGQKLVFIDYAHTPDALTKVLEAVNQHCTGDIILVFGCGGDRDKGKRPLMAKVAEASANKIFVTSDNPRNESPSIIIDDILSGFESKDNVVVEIDRKKAITAAVASAGDTDIVLIAGKGHENYQEIQDVKYPFSDIEEVKRLIA